MRPVDTGQGIGTQRGIGQRLIGICCHGNLVTAVATIQHIRTLTTIQHIVTGTAGNRIHARTTCQRIITRATIDGHGSAESAGVNRIGRVTTGQLSTFNSGQRIFTQRSIGQRLIRIFGNGNLVTVRTTIQHIGTIATS